jgi:hypothetical protein
VAIVAAAAVTAAGESVRFKQSEAARRFAERRERENAAPRLHAEIPSLTALDLTVKEHRADAPAEETTHVRRVVITSAPALFEIPCGDPSCEGGGHEVTSSILRALRAGQTAFAVEDVCHGSVAGGHSCRRVLTIAAKAKYEA